MRDPRLVVARRELASLRSEKTLVLALCIQLFVAAFSSFLVVGLVSLSDPGSVDGYSVEMAVAGDAREELLAAADRVDGASATSYDSRAAALSAFERGAVSVVLVGTEQDGRIEVIATAPEGSVETTLAVVQVRETLRELERDERERRAAHLDSLPLPLPDAPDGSPYYGFTYTVLLPVLLFLPAFISGSVAVDSLSEERDRGTLELLRAAPLTLSDVVDGKALAAAALAPAQAALWVALLRVNGTAVDNPGSLLALAGAFATLAVALGVGAALLAPDRRAAQFLFSVGVLGSFTAASVLPSGPANVAALLAVDSATTATYASVVVYAAVAVVAYAAVRTLAGRVDADAL